MGFPWAFLQAMRKSGFFPAGLEDPSTRLPRLLKESMRHTYSVISLTEGIALRRHGQTTRMQSWQLFQRDMGKNADQAALHGPIRLGFSCRRATTRRYIALAAFIAIHAANHCNKLSIFCEIFVNARQPKFY